MRPDRIRATSMGKPLFLILLSSGYLLWHFINKSDTSIFATVICTALLGYVIISELSMLVWVPYLTEKGIELWKFGNMYRAIKWEDVAQICVVHDLRVSMRVSGQPGIIITPRNCDLYDVSKWNGLQYRIRFRKQVIWIEYTKKNLHFISLHYGERIDYQ